MRDRAQVQEAVSWLSVIDFNLLGTSNSCVAPLDPLDMLVIRALVSCTGDTHTCVRSGIDIRHSRVHTRATRT
jgi:hypothetical protein